MRTGFERDSTEDIQHDYALCMAYHLKYRGPVEDHVLMIAQMKELLTRDAQIPCCCRVDFSPVHICKTKLTFSLKDI